MKAIVLALPLLFAAPLTQAADIKAVETKVETKIADMKGPTLQSKIDAANAQWLAAFNKGDAAAVTALYTEQATVLPPGADMAIGREAIQKVWQGAIQSGLKVTSLTTTALEQHGPIAREIGRIKADMPGPDTQILHLEGKYVVYWKEVKGQWKLDTDIWNMNK